MSQKPECVAMHLDDWIAIKSGADTVHQFGGAVVDGVSVCADDIRRSYGWMSASGTWWNPQGINSFEGTAIAVWQYKHEMQRELDKIRPYGSPVTYSPEGSSG